MSSQRALDHLDILMLWHIPRRARQGQQPQPIPGLQQKRHGVATEIPGHAGGGDQRGAFSLGDLIPLMPAIAQKHLGPAIGVVDIFPARGQPRR